MSVVNYAVRWVTIIFVKKRFILTTSMVQDYRNNFKKVNAFIYIPKHTTITAELIPQLVFIENMEIYNILARLLQTLLVNLRKKNAYMDMKFYLILK